MVSLKMLLNAGERSLRLLTGHIQKGLSGGVPSPPPLPEAVWINPPARLSSDRRKLQSFWMVSVQKLLTGSGPAVYSFIYRSSTCGLLIKFRRFADI